MTQRLWVGTRKGLFRFDLADSGAWNLGRKAFVGDPVTAVLPLADGRTVLAGLDHGHFGCKIQRSEDGGDSWAEVGVPVYPKKPESSEDFDPGRGRPIPWSTKLIWSLDGGGGDHPRRVWCGTIPGGLFKSEDAGSTWELVESLWNNPGRKKWFGGGMDLPGIHSVLVDPRDSDVLLVGVSCGGVWRSEDSGASWAQSAHGMRADYLPKEQAFEPDSQDPHRLAQCRDHPDRVWTQHHNGIFRSDDSGRNWLAIEDVSPSDFGFGVVCHPRNPDTAWFVPAVKDEIRVPVDGRFVVTKTEDGGKSFRSLTQGLPSGEAWDLVFRHALALDEDSIRIGLGSTTGSLWVSGESGESFEQLSAHLPPIYVIRFS
ncbi:MAG: exo-alpha-sialidase [Planctomycetota bacterium]